MKNDLFKLGYDYSLFCNTGTKAPIFASIRSHLIVVGGSGSGKSTSVLYWISKLSKHAPTLYIADFKKSNEFSGISNHFAQFEECVDLIREFYNEFLNAPEIESRGIGSKEIRKNTKNRYLIIDEVAGLLTYLSSKKETKAVGDEIRAIMATLLMMGRSRGCFLVLSMQRFSASIFPQASGAADNFMVVVGFGRLSVDSRKGLFAGEHFDGEEDLMYKTGSGIVLIDGQPLQAIILPKLDKAVLLDKINSNKSNAIA